MKRLALPLTAAVMLLFVLLSAGWAVRAVSEQPPCPYEELLFDTGRIHDLEIDLPDWDHLVAYAREEQYQPCHITLDGETVRNVGIRAKGNTSQEAVMMLGSPRYSLKIEFDHYVKGLTYHGLDKLNLNNLIQDATMMKEMLSYELLRRMNVPAPLCSYIRVRVNGKPLGLYLAVEGVDKAFLRRTGWPQGKLYKPELTAMAGAGPGQPPPGMNGAEDAPMIPYDANAVLFGRDSLMDFAEDVDLKYLGPDAASYPNIFGRAKSRIGKADQLRLIHALEQLNEPEGPGSAVDKEEVIRFLAVHSFLCNGDSYTGIMAHNYYLCEDDGRLHLIPWDYNLAFGGTADEDDAMAAVSTSVDRPVIGHDVSDRPLISWIFRDPEALDRYHALCRQFVSALAAEDGLQEEIHRLSALIGQEVAADPTAFYPPERFHRATKQLERFCRAREAHILAELNGEAAPAAEESLSLFEMGGIKELEEQLAPRVAAFMPLLVSPPADPMEKIMLAVFSLLMIGCAILCLALVRNHQDH